MDTSVILVVGLGQTGQSIARYLTFKRLPFILFDTRATLKDKDALINTFNVPLYLETLPASVWSRINRLIVSPGVSLDAPVIQEAKKRQLPIDGDIECLALEVNAPIIAITGTNGKSTVTSWVGAMAKTQGLDVAVAGNIGVSALDHWLVHPTASLWVLELSSFQLELTHHLKAQGAALLNITPDHLDRHHTMAAYIEAKQRIYHDAGVQIYNRQDMTTRPQHLSHAVSFGLDAPQNPDDFGVVESNGDAYMAKGDTLWMPFNEMCLKGQHNWQNAMAAAMLAESAGISKSAIIETLKTFKALPHRCERVRVLNDVEWIDDSKGTNVGATLSAILGLAPTLQGKIVLIAGGLAKGADFEALRAPIAAHARAVILIGVDAPLLDTALKGAVPVYHVASLSDAVLQARALAKPKDCVLLSPACASFDMFKDYHHRGEVFKQTVLSL